jgi:hypothetical protein
VRIEQIVDDWEGLKKRWCAWWEHDVYDGAFVCVTGPRSDVCPAQVPEVDVETQWLDVDFMIQRDLERVRTTFWGGGALPVFTHLWSAGHALIFGCEPHYAPDTVWVDPAPVGPDGYPAFEGWRESKWWPWMQHLVGSAARASQGRYMVGPYLGNHAGDNLALILGTENLLLKIATDRAWVVHAVKELSDILNEVIARLWELVDPRITGIEGSASYAGSWSPGRVLAFDCDISCMISPRDFREIFLPPLLESMSRVDHRVYHLDGTVALQHLPTLLALPELHAIQWIPGAGHEAALQWVPLIREIQSKSKSVVVYCEAAEVEPLLSEVRPEGLCVYASCDTETGARALLDRVRRQPLRTARG